MEYFDDHKFHSCFDGNRPECVRGSWRGKLIDAVKYGIYYTGYHFARYSCYILGMSPKICKHNSICVDCSDEQIIVYAKVFLRIRSYFLNMIVTGSNKYIVYASVDFVLTTIEHFMNGPGCSHEFGNGSGSSGEPEKKECVICFERGGKIRQCPFGTCYSSICDSCLSELNDRRYGCVICRQ